MTADDPGSGDDPGGDPGTAGDDPGGDPGCRDELADGTGRGSGREPDRHGDLLSEVLALLPDPVLLRRWGDDVVLECNRAFADLVGRPPARVRGRTLEELGLRFPADEREAFERRLEADGEVLDALLRVYRGDERHRHLVSSRRVLHRDEPCVISVSKDVTDRPRLARSLEASRRRYRALFDRNVAGTFRTALDGTILECNRAFARMFGYAAPEEVEGRSVLELYPSPEERERRIARLREEEALAGEELELRRRDGSPIWVLENSFLLEEGGGDGLVNMGTLVDITERKRLEERLERWAYRDALTGLANRRMLRSCAEGAIAAADRVGKRVGLVFLDLIRFKRVNDTLGHRAGDDVLVMAARRLESCVREADLVARTGGDEFAAVLPELEEERGLRRVAGRFVECFEDPFRIDDSEIHLDLQIGMALYPDHASNFNELLSRAGHALRAADVTAGLPAAIYEPVTGPGPEGELAREEQLRRALAEGELTLHYQPIRETATGALRGAEALVRWEHPDAGLLRAAEFVPLAERSGLIARLDRHVLRAAVRQLAAWETEDERSGGDGAGDGAVDREGARGTEDERSGGDGRAGPEWISVNLSAATLADPALEERVTRLLEEEGVPGERLAVEITERVALRDPDRVAETLEGLRRRGVRVAIDDFGTGRAVLAYLKQFAADILKLDMVFVQRVEESRRDEELVAGIAALGRQLGMEVLAEGVEDPGQLERLRSLGVDLVQGYHVGRPVAPAELNGRPPG